MIGLMKNKNITKNNLTILTFLTCPDNQLITMLKMLRMLKIFRPFLMLNFNVKNLEKS